jgi:hypothetical protein
MKNAIIVCISQFHWFAKSRLCCLRFLGTPLGTIEREKNSGCLDVSDTKQTTCDFYPFALQAGGREFESPHVHQFHSKNRSGLRDSRSYRSQCHLRVTVSAHPLPRSSALTPENPQPPPHTNSDHDFTASPSAATAHFFSAFPAVGLAPSTRRLALIPRLTSNSKPAPRHPYPLSRRSDGSDVQAPRRFSAPRRR